MSACNIIDPHDSLNIPMKHYVLEWDMPTCLSRGYTFRFWYMINHVAKIWTDILKKSENLLVRTQPCLLKPTSALSTCNLCHDVYISWKGNYQRLQKNVISTKNIVMIFCNTCPLNTHAKNEFPTSGWKSDQRSNISKGLLLTSYFLQWMDTSASRTEKNSTQLMIICRPKGLIGSMVGWLRIRM